MLPLQKEVNITKKSSKANKAQVISYNLVKEPMLIDTFIRRTQTDSTEINITK